MQPGCDLLVDKDSHELPAPTDTIPGLGAAPEATVRVGVAQPILDSGVAEPLEGAR